MGALGNSQRGSRVCPGGGRWETSARGGRRGGGRSTSGCFKTSSPRERRKSLGTGIADSEAAERGSGEWTNLPGERRDGGRSASAMDDVPGRGKREVISSLGGGARCGGLAGGGSTEVADSLFVSFVEVGLSAAAPEAMTLAGRGRKSGRRHDAVWPTDTADTDWECSRRELAETGGGKSSVGGIKSTELRVLTQSYLSGNGGLSEGSYESFRANGAFETGCEVTSPFEFNSESNLDRLGAGFVEKVLERLRVVRGFGGAGWNGVPSWGRVDVGVFGGIRDRPCCEAIAGGRDESTMRLE